MMKKIAGWAGMITGALLCASAAAQATDFQAEVSGAFGLATVQPAGAEEAPIRAGTRIPAGATIRTAPGAAVDLHLGNEAGVVRLTQSTMVRIERLQHTNSHTETYLYLQHGTILGNGSRVPLRSKYHIKTAAGIAAIGNAAFRLHAEGYLVVVDGKAQFAYTAAAGEPQVHTLSAPPAVYFSPTEGVKEAPKALVREIINQSKARLGSK
jgi:hypothetical protein